MGRLGCQDAGAHDEARPLVTPRRGDVWWARLDAPVGERPVLLLTRDAAIGIRNQVTVAKIMTAARGLESEVALDRDDGLPRPCVVSADTIMTIPKATLTNRIAELSDSRMSQVERAVRFALDLD